MKQNQFSPTILKYKKGDTIMSPSEIAQILHDLNDHQFAEVFALLNMMRTIDDLPNGFCYDDNQIIAECDYKDLTNYLQTTLTEIQTSEQEVITQNENTIH